MNGIAVAREIKNIHPTIPVAILSGFAELPGEGNAIVDRWILKGRPTESTAYHNQGIAAEEFSSTGILVAGTVAP